MSLKILVSAICLNPMDDFQKDNFKKKLEKILKKEIHLNFQDSFSNLTLKPIDPSTLLKKNKF